MKILFITPVVPTQTDGRRPFNFLKYLTRRHTVHLITMRMDVQTDADVERLRDMGVIIEAVVDIHKFRSLCQSALGLLNRRPLRVSWCVHPAVRNAIHQVGQKHSFDLVHIDRLRMGQYAPSIKAPVVIDFTDSLPLYLQRSMRFRTRFSDWLIDGWERFSIPRYERYLAKHMDGGLVCSDIDATVFQKNCPIANFHVIENAVDPYQFQPRTHHKDHRPRIVITGTLFYFPNLDSIRFYIDDILPALRERYPWLETLLIGTRPEAWVRSLDGQNGIQVLSDVPRMEEYLYSDDIYLCPLRVAAGVRNKLLEAMSAKMPIVTTSLGAEGLHVEDEREMLFAETPDQFIHQVERVIDSPQLREQLGQASRNYIKERHTLDELGRKLVNCYEGLLEQRNA